MQRGCVLDMDGVLAHFADGISRAHGRPSPYDDPANHGNFHMDVLWGMTPAEFFAPADHDFWAELDPLPDAAEIVDVCERYFGQENITILSSPSLNPGCMPGKLVWLEKHFPQFVDRYLFGKQKQFCAHPGNVLIDDYDKNVNAFRARNGNAFLLPRLWNSAYVHAHRPVDALREYLHSL